MKSRIERDSNENENEVKTQQTKKNVMKEKNQTENDKENCLPIADRFLLNESPKDTQIKKNITNFRTPLKNCMNRQIHCSTDDQQKKFHKIESNMDPMVTPIQSQDERTSKSPELDDNLEELLVYDSGNRNDLKVFRDNEEEVLQTAEIIEHFGCSPIYASKNREENDIRDVNSSMESLHPINSNLFLFSPTDSDTSDLTTSDNQDDTHLSDGTDDSRKQNFVGHELDDLDSIIEDVFDNIRSAIEMERDEAKVEILPHLPSAALLLQREQTRILEAKVNSNQIDLGDLSLSSKDSGSDCSISTDILPSISIDNSNSNEKVLDEPLQDKIVTPANPCPRYHKYFALSTFLIVIVGIWGLTNLTIRTFFDPITSLQTPIGALPHSVSENLAFQILRKSLKEDFLQLFEGSCSIHDLEEELMRGESQPKVKTPPTNPNSLISAQFLRPLSTYPSGAWMKESLFASVRKIITKKQSLPLAQPRSPFLSEELKKRISQIIQTRRRLMIQRKSTLESSILRKLSQLMSSMFIFLRRYREARSRDS
jgi:hypothetical protein